MGFFGSIEFLDSWARAWTRARHSLPSKVSSQFRIWSFPTYFRNWTSFSLFLNFFSFSRPIVVSQQKVSEETAGVEFLVFRNIFLPDLESNPRSSFVCLVILDHLASAPKVSVFFYGFRVPSGWVLLAKGLFDFFVELVTLVVVPTPTAWVIMPDEEIIREELDQSCWTLALPWVPKTNQNFDQFGVGGRLLGCSRR